MNDERFTLDTNILVYSVDNQAGPRQVMAREVIARSRHFDCHLTLQAVSEFYAAVTRKGRMQNPDASRQTQDWLDLFPCLPASSTAVRAALAASAGRRASYWDALLVATAAEGGCTVIVTEDMTDGSNLDGVEVLNPFGSHGLSPRARRLLHLT